MGVRLKDRSGRGVGFLIAILFLANYVNCQEYFIQGSRPVFVIPDEEPESSNANSQQVSLSAEEPEGDDVLRSRSGLDLTSSEEADSSSGQVGDYQGKDELGRGEPIDLPEGFDEAVKKNIAVLQHRRSSLHGDPGKLDEDDEEGRGAEPRLIWPFSIEITKGKGAANKGGGGGWGSPAQHGSFGGHPPPYPYRRQFGPPGGRGGHHHHHGHHKHHKGHRQRPLLARHGHGHGKGVGFNQEFHFSVGPNKHGKGHGHGFGGPPHFGGHHGAPDFGGHGWGAENYEHEKHKLKFEILKLKAKKKIALLQNKVELKKLLSLLLQKKIQALEWW